MDAIGTGLNVHSAEADSMRIQFCTVWTGLKSKLELWRQRSISGLGSRPSPFYERFSYV